MQSTSLGPPRIVGLHKRSAARFVPKSYVVYRRQPFVDVARLLGSTRQALVQASQHLNGGGTGNGNATGSVDQDGRAQRMPQPLRAIASQQGAREPSTLKTVVAQVDRLESIQPTDSMDGFASDYSDFSGEDELTSTSYGSQERAGAYSYNKSHYEVLRLDGSGRTRKFYVRRRDLLREYRLQPRDLRRIDPTIDFTKTSPSITIKENVLLLCLGGVRAIVTAEKALLFEPPAPATRRFIETVVPHLESKAEQRGQAGGGSGGGGIGPGGASQKEFANAPHTEYMARFYAKNSGGAGEAVRAPPFELEVLEGALVVATGRLDAEMVSVTARVQELLTRLPNDINPVSLEELRRVKAALVELENKADTLRNMLEELMDDEDELRELNLSSRPRREERRRQRERERLERELERAREIKEELEERLEEDEAGGGGSGGTLANSGSGGPGGRMMPGKVRSSTGSMSPLAPIVPPPMPAHYVDPSGEGYASWTGGAKGPILGGMPGPTGFLGVQGPGSLVVGGSSPPSAQRDARQERLAELRAKFDRERLAELRSKFGWGPGGAAVDGSGGGAGYSGYSGGDGGGRERGGREAREGREGRASRYTPAASREAREAERAERLERMRMARAGGPDDDTGDWISRLEQQLEGSEEDIQEAQEALEEMVEQEEEEQELEEVEDLMEYYLQRASAAQSEAERLLAGARDLEESIGVSLSARRYEVNRLELTLSIGSFAAALGAMIAGIFGMNMKSMLELSVASFWGVSAAIVVGCTWVFVAIMRYTRAKRIL